MRDNWISRRQFFLPIAEADTAIGRQVASGSFWSGLGVLATTVLQLVRSIIFARLLMPADFGVIALANVFTQFVLIFANFGFNASVIYQRSIDRKDLATCWWGNVWVDSVAAIICCGVALFTSRYADNPTTSYVICLLAVQFLFTSFSSINAALMRRLFMFKQTAIVSFSGALATFAVAVFCVVVLDWGVYGLVAGMIGGNLFMTVLNFVFLPWLPSFSFSWKRLRAHLGYGGWFLGVNVVTYANGNLDRTLVAAYLDTTSLGYYEYAANIPLMLATRLNQVLNSVLFPAISSLQDNLEQLGELLRKVYRYNALLIYPLLVGIGLVAPDFVRIAYGDKWLPIIDSLRLFCLFGLMRIFINPLHPLCNGLGVPRLPFKWTLLYLPINLVLVYLGIRYYGLEGVVAVRLVMPVFMTLTLGREIFKLANVSLRMLLAAVVPALVCCSVMAVVVLGTTPLLQQKITSPIVRLLVTVALGGLAYVTAVLVLFKRDREFLLKQARGVLSRG